LPVLRRRADVPAAQFRVAGGRLVAGLAVLLCLWLLSNGSGREVRDVMLAAGLGLLIFLGMQWRRPPR
jgi:hypothetical protein